MKETLNIKEKLIKYGYIIVYSSVKPQNGGGKIM